MHKKQKKRGCFVRKRKRCRQLAGRAASLLLVTTLMAPNMVPLIA